MLAALVPEGRALALLIAANALPLIAAKLAGERWSWPLDGGRTLVDGQRLFGAHKTWRGVVAGILGGGAVGVLLGFPLWLGSGFAAVSLGGDAASSAIKRRLRLAPGTEFPGLDQLGEAVLPLLVFARPLTLDVSAFLIVTATFIVLDLATAAFRRRPAA